ncbi:MAG TPA: ROK family protein, partial [bacterium]|nr:ROK family protein [bacterium]
MKVLGLDLGGTKLAAAVFSGEGHILHRESALLAGREGRDAGALIIATARAMAAREPFAAIGVSIPGIYYAGTGRVWAPNIPGWSDYPLQEELIQAFPELPVAVDSDRACYILGERWQGAARGCRNAIFLAVGTGIGAGILIEDRVLRGQGDIAGAVGWMGLMQPFAEKYSRCGCFEYHASGDGLAQVARDYLSSTPSWQGPLRDMDAAAMKGAEVFAASAQGDTLAQRVLDEAIGFWGMAAANLISTFNPEKIIFGGGVFGPAGQFLDRIRAQARKWAQPIAFTQVTLELSALGGDAGLIGAGSLALQAAQPAHTRSHPGRPARSCMAPQK